LMQGNYCIDYTGSVKLAYRLPIDVI
jgi:hypothetical protein